MGNASSHFTHVFVCQRQALLWSCNTSERHIVAICPQCNWDSVRVDPSSLLPLCFSGRCTKRLPLFRWQTTGSRQNDFKFLQYEECFHALKRFRSGIDSFCPVLRFALGGNPILGVSTQHQLFCEICRNFWDRPLPLTQRSALRKCQRFRFHQLGEGLRKQWVFLMLLLVQNTYFYLILAPNEC